MEKHRCILGIHSKDMFNIHLSYAGIRIAVSWVCSHKTYLIFICHMVVQGWKILKFFTRPTSPYVLVNSILNIGNSQNFYSFYSIRHSPWRVDEWIFPALWSKNRCILGMLTKDIFNIHLSGGGIRIAVSWVCSQKTYLIFICQVVV